MDKRGSIEEIEQKEREGHRDLRCNEAREKTTERDREIARGDKGVRRQTKS